MRYVNRVLVLVVIVAILITGCNSEPKKEDELPKARPLLTEAAGKVQEADSFELQIRVSGYPVRISVGDFPLPDDLPLIFQYAEGVFVAPDKVQATVQVSLGDVATTADIVAIGDEQYMRSDLLTQEQWLKQQIIIGFNPASLIAPEGGIADALRAITKLEMVGQEDMEGLDVFHLRGEIQASEVYSLTFGLIGMKSGLLGVEVYILVEERLIEQVVLREPLPEGVEDQEPTTWTINIMGYNEPFSISTPEVGATEES